MAVDKKEWIFRAFSPKLYHVCACAGPLDLVNVRQNERNDVCILIIKVEMPGIEPGAFHMQSERSTTELHPPVGKHKLVTRNIDV